MIEKKINGMITVRSKSTRLKNKCFLPFSGKTVIEHIIDRSLNFNLDPILCTTIEKEDDRLEEIAINKNIRYFRGSVEDKLDRWRKACEKYNIDNFISVDADDLFFDKSLVLRSFDTLIKGYDFVTHPKLLPYEGCVGYGITYDIIKKACQIKKTDKTEMMWVFIDEVKNLKKAQMHIPERGEKIRLTLDYIEDYWLMLAVERILGPYASMHDIIKLFQENPDLHKINWFRNHEYKQNHKNIDLE